MHKEYKYPANQQSPYPSPFFDKEYVVSILTRAFHLIFGLSVGIGIGMVVCGIIKAIIIVTVAALGYLGTETDAWFYLPACIFRLIRNDYPYNKHAFKNLVNNACDTIHAERKTATDILRKAKEWAERLPENYLERAKTSEPDMEETPNPNTTKEEKEDGGIQSEDDGGSESMDGT